MSLPRVTDAGSLVQQVAAAQAETAGRTARMLAGLVTAVDSAGNVTVNVDGSFLTGLSLSGVPLQAGDVVKVFRQAGTTYVVGLVVGQTRPTVGTVASVPSGSSTIVVTTTLGNQACGWVAAYSPVVGDAVWLVWLGSTPVVIGKQGVTGTPTPTTPPAPPAPPPAPPPKATTGITSFTCVSSGTYRGGAWLDNGITGGNVMQGDYGYGAADGAWFYGGAVHSTLAGATVTDCKIWLRRDEGGTYAAQTVHLSRVTNNTRPGGALTFDSGHATDSISLAVGQSGWFDLPNSIAQALVTSSGSLGVTSANPYVRLYGRPNDTRAGMLRVTWRR